jgi:hypothetical protein
MALFFCDPAFEIIVFAELLLVSYEEEDACVTRSCLLDYCFCGVAAGFPLPKSAAGYLTVTRFFFFDSMSDAPAPPTWRRRRRRRKRDTLETVLLRLII